MWRQLFSPKWLCTHIGVIALIVLMTNLGFWQLRRLDEKQAFNSRVTAQSTLAPSALAEVFFTDVPPSSIEWRQVVVEGKYVPSQSVTIINRSQDGSAGYDSLVPLRTNNGSIILVNRGFVPLAMATPTPPTGQIRVTGYLRQSQSRSTLGAIDSSNELTTEFQRFDIPRISQAISGSVLPMFVQRISETPTTAAQWPAVVALPVLDEGPHFSYAMQWFFFSLVALTAWVVVIRRKLTETISSVAAPGQTSA